MPVDDGLDGTVQCILVQPPVEPEHETGVVRRAARFPLVQEPELLLGIGQQQRIVRPPPWQAALDGPIGGLLRPPRHQLPFDDRPLLGREAVQAAAEVASAVRRCAHDAPGSS